MLVIFVLSVEEAPAEFVLWNVGWEGGGNGANTYTIASPT